MTTRSSPPTARPPADGGRSFDRIFYRSAAVVTGLTVFVGFAPTYYLRFFSGGPTTTFSGRPFTPIFHVHGALFTAWVLLFIIQTTLVAQRRVVLHRRLGFVGALLAVAMVIVGTYLPIAIAARAPTRPGVDVAARLAVPLFDMFLFAVFVTLAFWLRRDKEIHKRLMLLAYAAILEPAIARIPGVPPSQFPPYAYGIALLYIVAAGTYDFFSRRQVHKVYLWGGGLFAMSAPLRLVVSGTAAWHALIEFLVTRNPFEG